MKAKQKIISLNLALLLFVSLALPAGATLKGETARQNIVAPMAEGIGPAATEHVDKPAELSASGDPYYIKVGDTSFHSDVDKSGAGWTYTAANHSLVLDGYNGTSILASGDLVIYSYGENYVTGQDEARFRPWGNGIFADGELSVNVYEGVLNVNGGSDSRQAKVGIGAEKYLTGYVAAQATLHVTGGDLTSGSGAGYGGDAVRSVGAVSIFGSGRLIAQGGESRAAGGEGGCGIFARNLYLDVDCELYGGKGYYGGGAIWFVDSCSVGAIDATFSGGSGLYGYAVQNTSGKSWNKSEHTTAAGGDYYLTLTVKEYTLSLNGNGGWHDGRTYFSDTRKYPAFYPLEDYIFQRDKYTQVGWQEWDGSFVALDDVYMPEANTSLDAKWIMVDPGDIVINSLSGALDDGTHYRSQRTALTLPTQTTIPHGGLQQVLAWSSTVDAQPDPTTQVMQGVWYEGGSVVQPDKDSVQFLYARSTAGKYVRYHPNGGAFHNGGTLVVQGTTATTTDLEVYAIGGETMTAPEGCEFKGWSRAADVDAVRYAAGESITMSYMPPSETIDLYAVWEQREFTQEIEAGAQVRYNPTEGTVKIDLTDAWCREKGGETVIAAGFTNDAAAKLLKADAATCGAEGAQLAFQCSSAQPVNVKIFVLDEKLAPACEPREAVVFQPQG